MKSAGSAAWSEIIRATASVAEDVGRKAMPTWMKVGGALVSLASVASLGVVYALFKTKPTVSTRHPTQSRAIPELESTWRTIFHQLGELASYHKVPIGIIRRFATNTFRGTPFLFICLSSSLCQLHNEVLYPMRRGNRSLFTWPTVFLYSCILAIRNSIFIK